MTTMLRIIAFLCVLLGPLNKSDEQQHFSSPQPPLRGRIVRYDWSLHDTTINDDFVIRVLPDEEGKRRYVRITWYPQGWERPPGPPAHLDRRAFVGRGRTWLFYVDSRGTNGCSKVLPDHQVHDESGSARISRYVSTPGAEQEPVPPIETLICSRLQRLVSEN